MYYVTIRSELIQDNAVYTHCENANMIEYNKEN